MVPKALIHVITCIILCIRSIDKAFSVSVSLRLQSCSVRSCSWTKPKLISRLREHWVDVSKTTICLHHSLLISALTALTSLWPSQRPLSFTSPPHPLLTKLIPEALHLKTPRAAIHETPKKLKCFLSVQAESNDMMSPLNTLEYVLLC